MPTIGFWELTVVALIALIVVGPERLPTLARHLGRWVRQARMMMNRLKSEIEAELESSDIKTILPGENEPGEIDRLIMESNKVKQEIEGLNKSLQTPAAKDSDEDS
ncbi:MAG TPA: twin-arginine translocase subunit TatB [Gammaproteobacteria bacterium]|nr:twin-arginine translocase subunit TatB [Gammaproteobacteria bacterium]